MRATNPARATWRSLPESVRARIEDELGSPVVQAHDQQGGFSPGVAARVVTAGGRRAFVKAADASVNAVTVALHRREAAITAQLPALPWTAPLQSSFEHEGWVVLAFADVDGRHPRAPIEREELTRIVGALDEMWADLTPSPVTAQPVDAAVGGDFARWTELAANGTAALVTATPPDVLLALECRWPALAGGETLLHFDLRDDNLLLTEHGGVVVVDWPWACVGAAWNDAVLFLAMVEVDGGPPLSETLALSSATRAVETECVDALLAAFSGFLVYESRRPAPPALPTIRSYQAETASRVLRMLESRLLARS